MATRPKRESHWGRAVADTISATMTIRFYVYGTGLGGIAAAVAATWLLQTGQNDPYLVTIVPVLAVPFIGAPVGLLALFFWHLFRAPYRQRNEAHDYLDSLETDGVAAAIEAIRREGQLERFCARAELFGAGADYLNTGFSEREMGRLAIIGVVDSDAGHPRYKLTALGREVVKRACD